MSLRRCRTPRCPHWTREGYRDNPHMIADGMYCWRCRRKERRADAQALKKLREAEK